jgi:hypothetical protein
VHDVPTEIASLGFTAPLHALITGKRDERDRRVALLTAPRSASSDNPRASSSASRIKACAARRHASRYGATARSWKPQRRRR